MRLPVIFWYLDFAAPNRQLLSVGTYTGAARFPFQSLSQPGLMVGGDGRGCNTLAGSFQVVEVSYGPASSINSFDATFEQHCELAMPALRGEIRYNAHPVANLAAQMSAANIPSGIKSTLLGDLNAAAGSLGRGNFKAGANQLQQFIQDVSAQSGKMIDITTADALIAAAQAIIQSAGC